MPIEMQRCLSGLRSTIGNRVMRERIRRFKSSSLRQRKSTPFVECFFVLFTEYRRGFEGGSRFARAKRFAVFKAYARKRSRQRRQLIIVERGALLQAQILVSAPENKKDSAI